MISKELLSEVLELNIILVDTKYTESTSRVRYATNDINDYYINIYELAHKCKEWSYKQGYDVISYKFSNEASYSYLNLEIKNVSRFDKGFIFNGCFKNEFEADTEQQAIFEACEWILDNKEQK